MTKLRKKHLRIIPLEKRLMLDASLGALISSIVIPENTVNAVDQIIDADVTVTGTTTDFTGDDLTISTTGGVEDQLSIVNEGVGAGQIGVSGLNITYEGTIIGTLISDGTNGIDLQITLNINASKTSIEQLIEAVTYGNTSDTPTINRTINFSLGAYFSEDISLGIAPQNDVLTLGNNTGLTVNENATIAISNVELSVNDTDNLTTELVYNVTSSPLRGQLELTTNAGVGITSFTQDDIDSNRLVYVHDGSGSTSDSFDYTVTDGAAILSETTFNITINQINDPLTLTTNNAADVSLGFSTTIGGIANDFGTATYTRSSEGTFGSLEARLDNRDSQIRILFTTTGVNPNAIPGEVIFEAGNSGVGVGIYLNNNNEIVIYASNGTASPRLTSSISLEHNTQYAIVVEFDQTNDQIRLSYEQSSDHNWFFDGRNVEDTLSGFTNTNLTSSSGGGMGQANSITAGNFGGFNGTISGATDFQGTVNSLVISNTPATVTVVNNDLVVTDNDTTPSNIVYTITNLTDYGTVYLDGVALVLNDTFTQVDLSKGLVTYDSTGSPPGPGFIDSFDFTVTDGTTTLTDSFTINVNTVNSAPTIYDSTNIYTDDFEGGTAGWNNNTTSSDPLLSEFLGRFNRNVHVAGDQEIFQTFALSGSQEYVTVDFDFFEIDSWDNEYFYIYVDDVKISTDRLRWNVYDRPVDDSTNGVDVRVTELTNDDGYAVYRDVYRDQFYHYSLTIPTTSATVKIGFGTSLNSTNFNDESFGIDNVNINELRAIGAGTRSIDVSETIRNGQVATQIMAGDSDGGQTLTYSITGGTGVGIFNIDPATGVVTVIDESVIDFESGTTSYDLDIQVIDNGPGLLTDTQIITINILDAFENTLPTLTYSTFSISEDAANGTSIGTLPVVDAEGDGIERWQIIDGNELGIFTINVVTGEVTIADNSQINFESDNRHDVRIRAWDDNDLGLLRNQTMRINITNVDDAPTLDPETIGENASTNIFYSTDTGNFYRFVDSNANYATAKANAEAAILNGATGHLLTVESLAEKNFVKSIADQHLWMGISDLATEGEWKYTSGPNDGLQLWQGAGSNVGGIATNGFYTDWRGTAEPNNGTSYNGAVFYRNDGRWVDVPVTNNYRYMIEWEGTDVVNNDKYFVNFDVLGDINNGDSVGFVQGLDPEGDTLTYSITGGTGAGLFSINPATGEVTILTTVGLDPLVDYTLDVRVTEDNGTNQFADGTITIIFNENLSLDLNNGHTAVEGTTTIINPVIDLTVSDGDGVATDILFDIDTFPVNGQLELTTNAGVGIITFTLDDLNNNRVQYVHDGTETLTDSFTFTVTDGGQTLALETFNITITPVNDAPLININTGTTINEGGTVIVTNLMLDALDIDNADTTLTYTASAYASGQIEVGGIVQNTFTQDDINNNLVVFRHDSSEGVAASFNISLSDTAGLTDTGTFNLIVTAVNDSPAITTNTGFSVTEGGSHTITVAELSATDPDDAGVGLTYNLTNIVGGQVQLTTNLGVPAISFTHADLAANRVVFVHDGSEQDASFDVEVADGGEDGAITDTTSVSVTRIPVNDSPVISTNLGSSVNAGDITLIKTAVLDSTDPDDSGVGLTYTISNEINGQVELLSNPTVAITSFTQSDLENSLVIFRHDNSFTVVASFDISLADGGEDAAIADTATFNFVVDNTNDAPNITTNTVGNVIEEQSTIITTAILDSFDPDDFGIGLTYSITNPVNGFIALTSDLATPILSFTQSDLDSGIVTFIHDGSETLVASFDVELADGGENGATTDTATITLAVTPFNDSPTLVVNDGSPNLIDFNDFSIDVFDPTQDGSGGRSTATTVSPDGSEFTLIGNVWKKIDIPYTLTANTVLSFEFRADNIQEIHGIGFDNDGLVANGIFGYQLAGTQIWSGMDQTFRTYQEGDGWVRFDIPVGSDYTGLIDRMVFALDDDSGDTGTTAFRNVGFYENNLNLDVGEGGTFAITSAHINNTDPDDTGVGLTFTASNLSNGHIEVSGMAGTTFTQDDIDNNRVTFVHDGSDTLSAGFDISLTDGDEDGSTNDSGSFNLTINPINDAPIITVNNPITLAESSSATITAAFIDVTDSDNSPHDIIINVTSIASDGFVSRSSASSTPITSFTLFEIQNGLIQYVHGGSELATDSFDFTVTDGVITTGSQTFDINLTPTNDAVTLIINTGTNVNEAGSVLITNVMLQTTDIDNPTTDITYTISALTNGHVEISGVTGTTFTQDDIDNNRVAFIHNGAEAATASFNLSVIDLGVDGASASTATFTMTAIPVNDVPINLHLSNNLVSETESTGFVIGSLSTSDADIPSDTFTYSIINDPDGKFAIVGNQLTLNTDLNWVTANFHTVTIRTDDNNGGTFDLMFTIDVEKVENGNNTMPSDPNFGDTRHKLLDKDPQFDNEGSGSIISSFSGGGESDQLNAFYGNQRLGQLIRENTTFNIQKLLSETDDNNDATPTVRFLGNNELNTSPNNNGEQQKENRYTKMVDFLRSTQNFSDQPDLQKDTKSSKEISNEKISIKTIEQEFDDVLTYHQVRTQKLLDALQASDT